MPVITVNRKIADLNEQSPVIVIIRPGPDHYTATLAGEKFITDHSGRLPCTWTDGTGTTTITASQRPVPEPEPRGAGDLRSWVSEDLLILARTAGILWDLTGRPDPYDMLNDRQRQLLDRAAISYLTAPH